MKYYIAKDGKPEGPYTVEELKVLNISKSTLVWNEELKNWTPAGNVSELQECFYPSTTYPPQVPPQNFADNNICPKTWLAESILVTLFCCLPFGIVGIVKASQVESAFRTGNYGQAMQNSKDAANWTKWGFIVGLVCYLLYFILGFSFPAFFLSRYIDLS